jgi:hypothetical protein
VVLKRGVLARNDIAIRREEEKINILYACDGNSGIVAPCPTSNDNHRHIYWVSTARNWHDHLRLSQNYNYLFRVQLSQSYYYLFRVQLNEKPLQPRLNHLY